MDYSKIASQFGGQKVTNEQIPGLAESMGGTPVSSKPLLNPEPKKGGIVDFMKQDLTGKTEIPDSDSFISKLAKNIFQTTIGSKSLPNIVGRTIATPGVLKDQTAMSEQLSQIAAGTTALIKKMKTSTDPAEKSRLGRIIAQNNQTMDELQKQVGGLDRFTATPREAIEGTINTAATVGAAKAPLAATLPGRMAQAGTIGASLKTAEEVNSKDSILQAIPKISVAGATAAAVPLITEKILAPMINKALGLVKNNAVQGLARNVKEPLSKVRADVKSGKTETELAQSIIDKGIVGSEKKIMNEARDAVSSLEDEITKQIDLADSVDVPVDMQPVRDRLIKLMGSYGKTETGVSLTPGASNSSNGIQAVLDDLGNAPFIGVKEANIIKRNLHAELAKAYENPTAVQPAVKEAQIAVAAELRKGIEKAMEGAQPNIGALNAEQGFYLELQNALADKIAKNGRTLETLLRGSIGDIVSATGIFGGGAAAGSPVAGGAAGIAYVAAHKALHTTAGRTIEGAAAKAGQAAVSKATPLIEKAAPVALEAFSKMRSKSRR